MRELSIERNRLNISREAELKRIDDQFGPEIARLKLEIDAKSELLQGWAEANPGEFGKRKSIEMLHGVLGWRTGTPKLIKRAKATWDAMVEKVKETLGHAYIRSKEEVDRQTIIRAHEDGVLDPAQLRAAGLMVGQEETFFVEPMIDEQENRVLPERREAA